MSELSLSDLLLAQQLQNQNKGTLTGGSSLDLGSLTQSAGQLLPMLQNAGALGGTTGTDTSALSSIGSLGGSGEGFSGDTGDVLGSTVSTVAKIAPYIMAALA